MKAKHYIVTFGEVAAGLHDDDGVHLQADAQRMIEGGWHPEAPVILVIKRTKRQVGYGLITIDESAEGFGRRRDGGTR